MPSLEALVGRRARGAGAGVVVAGLLLLVAALWPGASWTPTGRWYLLVSLLVVFGSAGLAVVEILRPGVVSEGRRAARATAPASADHVPPLARVLSWAFIGLGVLFLALRLGMAQSRWFDAATVWRSPVPLLAVAAPLVTVLSELAARRVLDASQPARDEVELFWKDAVRANTLSALTVPPALVGLFGLLVSGAVLDAAASTVAVASGEVGPAWSLWVLVAGCTLPVSLVIGAVFAMARWGGSEMEHVRARLWGGSAAPMDA